MELELQSDRLILTPLKLGDIDLMLEMWTDPQVVRYIEAVSTEEDVRREQPDVVKRGANGAIGEWCIADRYSDEKYGCTYLLPMPTVENDFDYDQLDMARMPSADIEVGYFLKPSAWGSGYATEACHRMLQFAFQETELDQLVASVHEHNISSKNVLEKCGFQSYGRTLCWGEIGPIFKISRDEWMESHSRDNA